MNIRLLLIILLPLGQSLALTGQRCQCNVLTQMSDCLISPIQCCWEQNICKEQFTCKVPQIILANEIKNYCSQLEKVSCVELVSQVCIWHTKDNECIFFPGCLFLQDQKQCQLYEGKCNWSENQCNRIEFECKDYLSQSNCQMKNLYNKYCYWDDHLNLCSEAITCDQLPKNFSSDAECRNEILMCTVGIEEGCILSGQKCEDQLYQKQCEWDQVKQQKCIWYDGVCQDKSCDFAIKENSKIWTKKECEEYLDNEKCIRDGKGGCVENNCKNIVFDIDCTQSKLNCIWLQDQCFTKSCINAPSINLTFEQCQQIDKNCIQQKNGGCQILSNCDFIEVESSCKSDINGVSCTWTKEIKKCSQTECQDAPQTLKSNQECENFLQNSNCITKQGGGCKPNEYCSLIEIEVACVKDVFGRDCFWNSNVNQCQEKKCENASSQFITHQECNNFLSSCTISSQGFGCQVYNCINSLTQDICVNNINDCKWINKCQKKYCTRSLQYKSHNECNQYSSSCTLDNSGKGCVDIPLKCEAITNQNACYLKKTSKGYEKCGWDGIKCVEQNCRKAPKYFTTTIECDQYIKGCVSFAYYSQNMLISEGCFDLPNNCHERLSTQNCEVYKQEFPFCVWNSQTKSCIEKTCETAIIFITKLTISDCENYLEKKQCILNVEENTCVKRPALCKDIELQVYSHLNCNEILNFCTINENFTQCQTKQGNCSDYLKEEQCQNTIYGVDCIWQNQSCHTQKMECVNLQKCSDYIVEQDCFKEYDSEKNSLYECYWNFNTCISLRENQHYKCEYIYGTKERCEHFNSGCTNNNSATNNDRCFLNCNNISGQDLTFAACQEINSQCSINQLETNCVNAEQNCSYYVDYLSCYKDEKGNNCYFYNNSCYNFQSEEDCKYIQQDSGRLNHYNCQSFSSKCTVNFAGTSCQLYLDNCEQYTDSLSCSFSSKGGNCIFDSGCHNFAQAQQNCDTTLQVNQSCIITDQGTHCQALQNQCSDYSLNECTYSKTSRCFIQNNQCYQIQFADDCYKIIAFGLSYEICQSYSQLCSVNRGGTNCIPLKQYCTDYAINDCKRADEGLCISDSPQDNSCQSIKSISTCDQIFFGANNYSFKNCNQILNICTSNLAQTQCETKSCSNYQGEISYQNCQSWLNNCIPNVNANLCVQIQSTCESTQIENCTYSQQGECIILNEKCQKKSCQTIQKGEYGNEYCNNQYFKCMAGRKQQIYSQCSEYETQKYCLIDSSGKKCFWNPTQLNCVSENCSNIETSILFDTHYECQTATNLLCTVRSDGVKQIPGCMNRISCDKYNIIEQCEIDDNGNKCQWNINITPPKCEKKSCFNAPYSLINHEMCNQFDSQCTVNVIQISENDVQIKGCTTFLACEQYLIEDQCKLDSKLNFCAWNDNFCQQRSCNTASNYLTLHSECQLYLPSCTLSNSGQGCMIYQNKCEEYLFKESCNFDIFGKPCYWFYDQCQTQNCQSENEEECQSQSICQVVNTNCVDYSCEDYEYTTDIECKLKMEDCTTDGSKCIKRGECIQAIHKNGCVTSSKGDQCTWVEIDDNDAYCDKKSCELADIKYKTELDCSDFYSICTLKNGGGCQLKKNCSIIITKEGCTYDNFGIKCAWFDGFCRQFSCLDRKGTSYFECNQQDSNCTIDKNNYCTQIKICEEYINQIQCIYGINGPCIWISDTQTNNNENGKCYKYDSCESFQWKTDIECKQISKYCTTNGNNCVPITLCEKTNTNGGCVTGIDGDCIQTKSNDLLQCELFKSCQLLNSEQECQQASKKCKFDGQKCIDQQSITSISDCNTLSKEACSLQPNCFYNGISCQNYQKNGCESFDVTNCKFNHISGRYCYLYEQNNQSKCGEISSCSQFNNDSYGCVQFSDYCYLQTQNNVTECLSLTCEINYIKSGICQRIQSLNFSQITFCELNNYGQCEEANWNQYQQNSSNCFHNSGYFYYWNQVSNACEACNLTQQNQTQNETQNSTQSIYSFQIQIFIQSFILGLQFL